MTATDNKTGQKCVKIASYVISTVGKIIFNILRTYKLAIIMVKFNETLKHLFKKHIIYILNKSTMKWFNENFVAF